MTDTTQDSAVQDKRGAGANGDNPLLGVLFVLAFCTFIPLADALVKMLGQTVPVMTLLVFRFSIQVLCLIPVMLYQQRGIGHIFHFSPSVWGLLFWRTVMHAAGIVGMYFGLRHMPLADTTAIAFIFPLLMLFAGHIFLKEQVGPHRIIAALVGFVGTLLVVQPNFIAVGASALWPVGVACTFVVFMLVTRKMSRDVDPISIQVVTGIMALISLFILIPLVRDESARALHMVWPSSKDWGLLIAVGLVGTFGHLLMTAAIRFAPAATLAPMQYLEIPFATLIGWIFFSDLPNQMAAIGIGVTISSGLYIIYREQKFQRRNRI